ncbi:hypothetical protein GAY33_05310 [Azospirillum brasilense]|uniref:hypothetical protein n=1 Tax=Azospirillum argentinense TaxID=2970906 RepID=UPI00190A45CC|nr:hypothetical protein [Azospirillum argentinense]MBK3798654.1 hypothetical protein [Azospirillum argentinense]
MTTMPIGIEASHLAFDALFTADDRLPDSLAAGRRALAASLHNRGVELSFSDDWHGLEAVNSRNRNSWFELLPRPATAPAFWLAARDARGEVVGTQGAVFLDCAVSSFGQRLGDLSAFHDPGTQPPADREWCFCASDAAFDTVGRVAFVVAGWVRPDWRGKGLFHPMAALMRIACWHRWDVSWWAGLVDPETIPVWNARGSGKRRLEPRPTILYHQNGVGRLPLHLLRFSRPAVILDAGRVAGKEVWAA